MLSLNLGFPKAVTFAQGNLKDNLANKHLCEIQALSTQLLFLTPQKKIINKRRMKSNGQPQLWKVGPRIVNIYVSLFPRPDREISFAEG